MHRWLETYDRNLLLKDLVRDPLTDPVAAALAMLSLDTELDSGFYDAEALADAVTHLWQEATSSVSDERSEARPILAGLLEAGGDYMRSLYEAVGPLPLPAAATLLSAHAKRMMERADMMRFVQNAAACRVDDAGRP